jgi:hypothetical protein
MIHAIQVSKGFQIIFKNDDLKWSLFCKAGAGDETGKITWLVVITV